MATHINSILSGRKAIWCSAVATRNLHNYQQRLLIGLAIIDTVYIYFSSGTGITHNAVYIHYRLCAYLLLKLTTRYFQKCLSSNEKFRFISITVLLSIFSNRNFVPFHLGLLSYGPNLITLQFVSISASPISHRFISGTFRESCISFRIVLVSFSAVNISCRLFSVPKISVSNTPSCCNHFMDSNDCCNLYQSINDIHSWISQITALFYIDLALQRHFFDTNTSKNLACCC